jgi:hypothetical protein
MRESVEEDAIISAFATGYRTLVDVKLFAELGSSASLLKLVESCLDLEIIDLRPRENVLMLKRSDILAIASLPRLKTLDLGNCRMADKAFSAFSRIKGFSIPSLTSP